MSDQDITTRILAFAHHCGAESSSAETVARRRGWIAEDGAPTDEGRELVEALDGQSATRSVFRTVF
jgi:hypothetical protein